MEFSLAQCSTELPLVRLSGNVQQTEEDVSKTQKKDMTWKHRFGSTTDTVGAQHSFQSSSYLFFFLADDRTFFLIYIFHLPLQLGVAM